MLKLTVVLSEDFDNKAQEFIIETFVLELEHSLLSLSKWESKYEKPFLGDEAKTTEEILGYIECMILTPDYPSDIVSKMSKENLDEIDAYIQAKMTATWFAESKTPARTTQKITSELVYYWMVSYQIPWEAENWHLNRLFTLIKVFNANNEDRSKTKKTAAQIAAERNALNEKRKAQMNTRG